MLELPLGYDRERPLRLTTVSYKSQVDAGTNYFIKVTITFSSPPLQWGIINIAKIQ